MMNDNPQVCGVCSREALIAPCSRGCNRLAIVCGCVEVLSLDGACAVCARAPRERVEVDVITVPPRSRVGGVRKLSPEELARATIKPFRPK